MDIEILDVYAGYNLSHNIADHRVIIEYTHKEMGTSRELVISPHDYDSSFDIINPESMGKEFFLDLMSKLYDMAEVK